MVTRQSKSQPTWTDVKARLANLDRAGLVGLIQDLYTVHKDNQTFLHARFGLGEDVLEPYKQTIERWLWPDVLCGQDTSLAKAKQALTNYKKAMGEPAGMAELMVFYCEGVAGFWYHRGYQNESYFAALVRMFEQAVGAAYALPTSSRNTLIDRLQRVRGIGHEFGYGVGDSMDFTFVKYPKRKA